jgi:hypothetical protein
MEEGEVTDQGLYMGVERRRNKALGKAGAFPLLLLSYIYSQYNVTAWHRV